MIPILESKYFLCLFMISVFYTPFVSRRSIKLLVDSENIQRLFIDEFQQHMEFIGPASLLFYDSLTVHDNCENLRSKYVLNPTSDGDSMSYPAKMMVSAVKPLERCTCSHFLSAQFSSRV